MKIACSIVSVLFLTACTSYRTVSVSVRDGNDHEPVADARVQVRPVQLFNPSYPSGIITPFPHKGAEAVTDNTGTATLVAPARHAFELFVFIPWETPRGLEVDQLGDTASPWLELIPGADEDAATRSIEVRIE